METNKEKERKVYVKPAYKVVQMCMQQMIATSGGAQEYSEGYTEDWFNN